MFPKPQFGIGSTKTFMSGFAMKGEVIDENNQLTGVIYYYAVDNNGVILHGPCLSLDEVIKFLEESDLALKAKLGL